MIFRNNKTRGDTMVEVLLSTMILSTILASAYTLTSRATLLNRVAFERTQVSASIQQQAELLRSARDRADTDPSSPWQNIVQNYTKSSVSLNCKNNPTFFDSPGANITGDYFYLDNSGNLQNDVLIENLFHIWIEAESTSGQSYIDFHINACWENVDESENLATGLVLRLEKSN